MSLLLLFGKSSSRGSKPRRGIIFSVIDRIELGDCRLPPPASKPRPLKLLKPASEPKPPKPAKLLKSTSIDTSDKFRKKLY